MSKELQDKKHLKGAVRLTTLGRMKGSSVIKLLVIVPVTLIVLLALVFAFYAGRKAYWDYRVTEMCEKDGGVTVYEKSIIPEDYVDQNGIINIPSKSAVLDMRLHFERKETDPFYYEWKNEPIKTGNLSVEKHTLNIIRSSDKKTLGRMVVYSRSGGDFPTFAHPSSTSCPDPRGRQDLLKMVFVMEYTSRRKEND